MLPTTTNSLDAHHTELLENYKVACVFQVNKPRQKLVEAQI